MYLFLQGTASLSGPEVSDSETKTESAKDLDHRHVNELRRNDAMPDEEELPDREALDAFLEGSSDDEVSNGNMTDPETLPAPDLVDSDSSLSDPDDLPFLPSNK